MAGVPVAFSEVLNVSSAVFVFWGLIGRVRDFVCLCVNRERMQFDNKEDGVLLRAVSLEEGEYPSNYFTCWSKICEQTKLPGCELWTTRMC